MTQAYLDHVTTILAEIEAEGMLKSERMITSPQRGQITVGDRDVINLCANNYLGLADHLDLIKGTKTAMDPKGFGMASVLFAACFDANGGLFGPLFGPHDAII